MTYPNEKVRELAASFVCVRIDFDKNPDVVKKHGVKALTDVRLIDADGKEAAKLVGFTSAAKLAAKMKAVLDGKPTDDAAASALARVPVTDENVERAVKKGLDFLRGAMKAPSADDAFAPDDLVLFARAASGDVGANDDACAALAKRPIVGTYQASLRALALARVDAKKFRDEIAACARLIASTQLENGQWTYGAPKDGEAKKPGDNSNTAYALLGLAACRLAQVDVPSAAIEKADAWWRRSQNADGGWGYRPDRESESYASMTESGLASLLLCRRLLAKPVSSDPAIEKATAWLAKSFSATENLGSTYQQGRLLYHLFALERAGTLGGAAKLGEHDWFAEGASFLLSTQRSDGSWDDGADTPVPNTCFALLFLKRGSAFLK